MLIDTEVFRRQVRGLRQIATAAEAIADTVTGAYETATGAVERSRDVISLVFASAPEAGSIGRLQLRARIEHR
jgi:hypothetical protein